VRALRGAGLPAVGITGSDGATFDVVKKSSPTGKDLGQVGEVSHVNTALIESLLDQGFLPVLSSVSSDETGLGYNVNADLAAGSLAGAFKAERAIFMTDVPGIYRNYPEEDSLIQQISLSDLRRLAPSLATGMIPKVEAVITALESGARSASVIDGRDGVALSQLLTGNSVGTEVIHG
jgi:acetylglutamate kinase